MLLFTALAFARWSESGDLYFLLLTLRDAIAAYFLVYRSAATRAASGGQELLAYCSSAIPLAYLDAGVYDPLTSASANLLTIGGFLLVTLATIDLGYSFGVSPAFRSVVSTGVYRWFRHPMYIGYCIAEFGRVLVNPLNAPIFLLSVLLYYQRSTIEASLLKP